eukprot:1143354-Pelagomonas_calceolata.AAC.2
MHARSGRARQGTWRSALCAHAQSYFMHTPDHQGGGAHGHFMVGGHDLRGPATPGGGTTEAKKVANKRSVHSDQGMHDSDGFSKSLLQKADEVRSLGGSEEEKNKQATPHAGEITTVLNEHRVAVLVHLTTAA